MSYYRGIINRFIIKIRSRPTPEFQPLVSNALAKYWLDVGGPAVEARLVDL